MAGEPLPVAVVGVGGFGANTLSALARSEAVRVVGVADRDAAAAQRAARQVGAEPYTDNRRLLAETQPAAAYLAVPPPAGADLVAACAQRGVAVWKEAPLARSLPEGAAMVRRMDEAGVPFAVGTQRRFAPGYRRAWELRGELGQLFLGRAHYLFNWGPSLGWRGDRQAAGGGALLELGTHPVDLLVWMLGLPEEAYGLTTTGTGRPAASEEDPQVPQVLYDTDDTAAAVLRYHDGRMATVVTSRASGPVSEELCLHGRGGSLRADAESCLLRDPDGNVRDHVDEAGAPLEVFQRQAEAFARAVADRATHYECSARENLLNLAVIEAVYLSGRTNQPETPARLLRAQGWKVPDCLACRRPAEPPDLPASE